MCMEEKEKIEILRKLIESNNPDLIYTKLPNKDWKLTYSKAQRSNEDLHEEPVSLPTQEN